MTSHYRKDRNGITVRPISRRTWTACQLYRSLRRMKVKMVDLFASMTTCCRLRMNRTKMTINRSSEVKPSLAILQTNCLSNFHPRMASCRSERVQGTGCCNPTESKGSFRAFKIETRPFIFHKIDRWRLARISQLIVMPSKKLMVTTSTTSILSRLIRTTRRPWTSSMSKVSCVVTRKSRSSAGCPN